jgi:hypothetical protein
VYDCNSGLSSHEDQWTDRQTRGIRDFGRFILLRATCTYSKKTLNKSYQRSILTSTRQSSNPWGLRIHFLTLFGSPHQLVVISTAMGGDPLPHNHLLPTHQEVIHRRRLRMYCLRAIIIMAFWCNILYLLNI